MTLQQAIARRDEESAALGRVWLAERQAVVDRVERHDGDHLS